MLNPDFIRENPDKVKKYIAAGRSKPDKANVDEWLQLDEQRRLLLNEQSELNREKNELAKLGKTANVETIRAKGKELKEKSALLDAELKEVTTKWQTIMDWFPNIPLNEEDMPWGKGEEDDVVTKTWLPDGGELELPADLKLKDFDEK